ncbi:hypothetical protein ACNKHU_20140 [Shigella flexneri]
MQVAFVDLGWIKPRFFNASDITPHTEMRGGEEQKQFTVRDISELVRQGQDSDGAGGGASLALKVRAYHRYHAAFSPSGVYARGFSRWGFPVDRKPIRT